MGTAGVEEVDRSLAQVTVVLAEGASDPRRQQELVRWQNLQLEHVLTPAKFAFYKSEELCSRGARLTVFHKRYDCTLAQEIARRRAENKPFSEPQLLAVLAGAVRGLASLEEKQLRYNFLRAEHIVLVRGAGVLVCPLLCTGLSNNDLARMRQIKLELLPGVYPAPEQLQAIKASAYVSSAESAAQREARADLFSLGVVLLEAALLAPQQQLYQGYQSVSQLKVAQAVESVRANYPLLSDHLRMMLSPYKLRPLPSQLLAHLSSQGVLDRPKRRFVKLASAEDEFGAQSSRSEASFDKQNQYTQRLSQKGKKQHSEERCKTLEETQHPRPNSLAKQFFPQRSNVVAVPPPTVRLRGLDHIDSLKITPQPRQLPRLLHPKGRGSLDEATMTSFEPTIYNPATFTLQDQAEPKDSQRWPVRSGSYHSLTGQPDFSGLKPVPASAPWQAVSANGVPLGDIKIQLPAESDLIEVKLYQTSKVALERVSWAKSSTNKQPSRCVSFSREEGHCIKEEECSGCSNEMSFEDESFRSSKRNYYEGQSVQGLRQGRGKFYFEDGGMYEGDWDQGKMEGEGRLYLAGGKLAYEGHWRNNKFEGRGILFNSREVPLVGDFDCRDLGQVAWHWVYYEGQFRRDLREGRGKLLLTNGEFFEGEFRGDQAEGLGRFHRRSGEDVLGRWAKGRLQERYC